MAKTTRTQQDIPIDSQSDSGRLVAHVDLDRLGFAEFSLIEGERIDTALDLRNGAAVEFGKSPEMILLTDRRVIHLARNGGRQKAVFISIKDIDAIEIESERESGHGALVWGAVAMIVAVMLWRVWDQPFWSPVVAVAVALMGAYLVFDRLTSSVAMQATFRAGSSQMQCSLRGDQASQDVYALINRLSQLKDERGNGASWGKPPFSPR